MSITDPKSEAKRIFELCRANPRVAAELKRLFSADLKRIQSPDNPFLSGNRTLQAQLVRSDPARAAKLKAEAASAEPETNPFAVGTRNLSEQALLMKSNPARATKLRAQALSQGN
jgi:hypothetical protein